MCPQSQNRPGYHSNQHRGTTPGARAGGRAIRPGTSCRNPRDVESPTGMPRVGQPGSRAGYHLGPGAWPGTTILAPRSRCPACDERGRVSRDVPLPRAEKDAYYFRNWRPPCARTLTGGPWYVRIRLMGEDVSSELLGLLGHNDACCLCPPRTSTQNTQPNAAYRSALPLASHLMQPVPGCMACTSKGHT